MPAGEMTRSAFGHFGREACEREAQVARARARPRNTALMLSPRESGFTPRLAAQQQSNGFAPSTTYQQLCSLTPKPPPISTLIRPNEYELVTTFHRQKFHLDWDESKVDHQVFPVDPAVARRRQIQQLRAQARSLLRPMAFLFLQPGNKRLKTMSKVHAALKRF